MWNNNAAYCKNAVILVFVKKEDEKKKADLHQRAAAGIC